MGFMNTLGQGLYAAGGGDLESYMKITQEKEDEKKKAKAMEVVADSYGEGGEEGIKSLGKMMQENPGNEYLMDAVNEFGTLQKTMKGMGKSRLEQMLEAGKMATASNAIYEATGERIDVSGIGGALKPRQTDTQQVNPSVSQEAPPMTMADGSNWEAKDLDKWGNPTGYKDVSGDKKLKKAKTDMLLNTAKDTIGTIGEIKEGLRYFGAASKVPPFPMEYKKKNWAANLDKLKSKLVLDVMAELKSASKTGSTGFGQLSEKELKVLQDAATALKGDLSEKDAEKYLNQIEDKANKILGKDVKTQISPEDALAELKRRRGGK